VCQSLERAGPLSKDCVANRLSLFRSGEIVQIN
jgi:hypothetical protein